MSYETLLTATAERDLQRIPPRIVPAIIEFDFGALAAAQRVVVMRIDHRSNVYRTE